MTILVKLNALINAVLAPKTDRQPDLEAHWIAEQSGSETFHQKMQWTPWQETWLVARDCERFQPNHHRSSLPRMSGQGHCERHQEVPEQQVNRLLRLLQVREMCSRPSGHRWDATHLHPWRMSTWKMAWWREPSRSQESRERAAGEGGHLRNLQKRILEEREDSERQALHPRRHRLQQRAGICLQDGHGQALGRGDQRFGGSWQQERTSTWSTLATGPNSSWLAAQDPFWSDGCEGSLGLSSTMEFANTYTFLDDGRSSSSPHHQRLNIQVDYWKDWGLARNERQSMAWADRLGRGLVSSCLWRWLWGEEEGHYIIQFLYGFGSCSWCWRCRRRSTWRRTISTWSTRTWRRRTRTSCSTTWLTEACLRLQEDLPQAASIGCLWPYTGEEIDSWTSWTPMAFTRGWCSQHLDTLWTTSWCLEADRWCHSHLHDLQEILTSWPTSSIQDTPGLQLQRAGAVWCFPISGQPVHSGDWRSHQIQSCHKLQWALLGRHPECLDERMDQVLWPHAHPCDWPGV